MSETESPLRIGRSREVLQRAEVRRLVFGFKTVERGNRGCEPTGTYSWRVLKPKTRRRTGRDASIKWLAGFLFLLLPTSTLANEFDHSHSIFADVLQNHVTWNNEGTTTTVDYTALKADPANLNQYLTQLSSVQKPTFNDWTKRQQLAFLINAYNAFTLKLIINHYPVDSIRDIGSFWKSPWEKRFFTLLGKKMHLDQIEHQIIREPGVYNEPRIHFAVNCASIGCPALRTDPFTAEQLEQQLDDSTRRFLRDETRNRYRDGRLEVSSIFKWYREDFQRGWNGVDSREAFFLRYADELNLDDEQKRQLDNGAIKYRFLDYDWTLNDSSGG